jgi:glycosyltransferase involved in cell wall biosynthesis
MPLPRYPGLRMGLPAGGALARAFRERRPDLVHVVTEGPLGLSALTVARRMGLPVVALTVMGTADVLQEGRGTRIARDDPDDFADRVEALLENAPERQRLAASGREYVRQWTAAETTARLMGFYEEIRLNRRPAQAHAEAEGFLSQTDCRAEAAGRAASRR